MGVIDGIFSLIFGGGTRQGVKCLHAHVAYHLAGGDDRVGRWTLDHLDRPIDSAVVV